MEYVTYILVDFYCKCNKQIGKHIPVPWILQVPQNVDIHSFFSSSQFFGSRNQVLRYPPVDIGSRRGRNGRNQLTTLRAIFKPPKGWDDSRKSTIHLLPRSLIWNLKISPLERSIGNHHFHSCSGSMLNFGGVCCNRDSFGLGSGCQRV